MWVKKWYCYCIDVCMSLLNSYLLCITGGGRGIRTPGTLPGSVVFKTTAIDHSAIPPRRLQASIRARQAHRGRITVSVTASVTIGTAGDDTGPCSDRQGRACPGSDPARLVAFARVPSRSAADRWNGGYLAGWMRRLRKAPGMLSTHKPTSPSRCPSRLTTRQGCVPPSTETLTVCFVTSMRT